MGVLEWSLGHTNRDEILRIFIAQGAYDLFIGAERGTIQLDGWSGARAGTRIVMSALFEQSLSGHETLCAASGPALTN